MKRYTPAIVMIVGLTFAPVFGQPQFVEPRPDQFSVCFRGRIPKTFTKDEVRWFQIMLEGPDHALLGTLRTWNDAGVLQGEHAIEIYDLAAKNCLEKGRRIKINRYDFSWYHLNVTRLSIYDIKMVSGTLSGLYGWFMVAYKDGLAEGCPFRGDIMDLGKFNDAEASYSVPGPPDAAPAPLNKLTAQIQSENDPKPIPRAPRKKALIVCQDFHHDPESHIPSVEKDYEIGQNILRILKFDDVASVTDFERFRSVPVTGERIRHEIELLKKDVRPGDTLLFYGSMHGFIKDLTRDHLPTQAGSIQNRLSLRREQTYCGANKEQHFTGLSTSDGRYYTLKEDLMKGVPKGVTIVVILNACHSGKTMNLKYTLDMTQQSCKWLNAKQRSEDPGPLVVSFASSEKQQTSVGLEGVGGFFSYFMMELMATYAKLDTSPPLLKFVKNLADWTSSNAMKFRHKDQAVVVTTNMPDLDLNECTLLDLVNGSICDKDGSNKQQRPLESLLKPDAQETPHSPHPPCVISPVLAVLGKLKQKSSI